MAFTALAGALGKGGLNAATNAGANVPIATALGTAAANIAGAGISSALGGTAAPAVSGVDEENVTDIRPVGVNVTGLNLGEAFKNFGGNPANGGFGFDFGSFADDGNETFGGQISASGSFPIALIAIAGVGFLVFLSRKRK